MERGEGTGHESMQQQKTVPVHWFLFPQLVAHRTNCLEQSQEVSGGLCAVSIMHDYRLPHLQECSYGKHLGAA